MPLAAGSCAAHRVAGQAVGVQFSFSGGEGGLGSSSSLHSVTSGVRRWRRARVQRATRRMVGGVHTSCTKYSVSRAAPAASPRRLVKGFSVLHLAGQPVFKGGGVSAPLAAWWSHSEGTASAAGRVALAASPRCARPRGSAGCIGGSRCSRAEVCSVQHARCALWWLCKWRYILGSGKGGLGGLPSLRPSKGIDGWHSVAQQVLEGGGCSHAACRSPHAGWWSCSGGTASAAARAASAASPRRAWSTGSVCSVA